MILTQISYADCLVFVLCLMPQLLLKINFLDLLLCVLQVLPFLSNEAHSQSSCPTNDDSFQASIHVSH